MTKTITAAAALLLCCIGLWAAPTNTAPIEPTYDGKPVSYWMACLEVSHFPSVPVVLSGAEENTLQADAAARGLPVQTKWSKPAPGAEAEREAARMAFCELGLDAVPFILSCSWEKWIEREGYWRLGHRMDARNAVFYAFRCLKDEDKAELRKILPSYLKHKNPQVRASTLMAMSGLWLARCTTQEERAALFHDEIMVQVALSEMYTFTGRSEWGRW